MNRRILIPLLPLFITLAAHAADVEVKSAWVRGTVPAQTVSGAFMELISKGGATLVGAATPLAGSAEVHEMQLDGGVMKMRAVPRLALPAGETVSLKPGSYHLMLMDLKRQLKPGEKVSIALKIEGAGKKTETITVSAEVREMDGSPGAGHHEHRH